MVATVARRLVPNNSAEILPKEIRGWGTTLVATTGVFGAILAYFVAATFEWRISYFVGGGLGLFLLLMRVRVFESGVFLHLKNKQVQRGNFFMLFSSKARFTKYLYSILIGTIYFCLTLCGCPA